MQNPFSKIKIENITNKIFSYSKGTVNLKFTLRTDIKIELKDFLELLKVAQKDIEIELSDK